MLQNYGSKHPPQMWSIDTLQQYICWVQQLQPRMTPEAEQVLLRYYQVQRGASGRDAARTTVRMFESLIRIAQVRRLLEMLWRFCSRRLASNLAAVRT